MVIAQYQFTPTYDPLSIMLYPTEALNVGVNDARYLLPPGPINNALSMGDVRLIQMLYAGAPPF